MRYLFIVEWGAKPAMEGTLSIHLQQRFQDVPPSFEVDISRASVASYTIGLAARPDGIPEVTTCVLGNWDELRRFLVRLAIVTLELDGDKAIKWIDNCLTKLSDGQYDAPDPEMVGAPLHDELEAMPTAPEPDYAARSQRL